MFMRLSFAAAVIALTGAASAKPVTLSAETNLRAAPGTKSDIVTLMPKGAAIEVGECDAGWCKVAYDGKDGFAIERNLGATPQQAAAPSRARQQANLQRLRHGYEDYFDGGPTGSTPQRRVAQNQAGRYSAQDDYYDDEDDAPVVYSAPGYVAGPPVYYYPAPRVYYGWGWGRPYGYWRRW
jgi:uncharacterized protein YgiM (DUF1202 family)